MNNRYAGCFILAIAWALPSQAASSIDPFKFFKSIDGQYEIVSVGGQPPHPEGSVATVVADAEESTMAMPYCPPGEGCLPGYVDFPMEKTTASQTKLADGTVRTRLEVAGAGANVYYWSRKGATNRFQSAKLEHVLQKKLP